MAARLRRNHQDDVRNKIQVSQIINRLMNHHLGKVEMTPTQLRAGEILLRKRLPDLSQVSGPGEGGEHRLEVTWEGS